MDDDITPAEGDCIMLGAKKVCCDVNFHGHTFKLCDMNEDLNKMDLNPLFNHDIDKWPLIASLLGYDYIDRIKNVGFATVFQNTLPRLVEWTADEAMHAVNKHLKHKMTEDYKEQLFKFINLFRYALVLNFANKLVPLKDNISPNEWVVSIGFNVNRNNMLPVPDYVCFKSKSFDGCSFSIVDSSESPEHTTQKHGHLYDSVAKDAPMPLHSIIDFENIPVRCCASIMLQNYVASHLGYDDSKCGKDLTNVANNMHEHKKPVLEPEIAPM